MKRYIFFICLSLVAMFLLALSPVTGQCQWGGYRGGYGYEMGPGMMWGWQDMNIPLKLTPPKNQEWLKKLKEIYALEKQSLAQYQADQKKFNAYMPYMMVIPQEEDHIHWIGQLFAAYGLPGETKLLPIVDSRSLVEAYELSRKMEDDLLPRYEWLVKNAEDRDTAEVLNYILVQSRQHAVMFEHALRMGHGYGFSRGPGMMGGGMGYGMRGGYGYGYGQSYEPRVTPLDMAETKNIMEKYLKSLRNPNLKLGKIKDLGHNFEAEILTNSNALVDRMLIDKNTGYMRSAY
ncbi:MAG: hypothetical protein JW902_09440 [Syntrophaceae bacterium]|nr:hypothetical protein [Syntrophaceae bacterium]